MVLGDQGTIFVGTRSAGNVYAMNNCKQYTIATNLNMPNGLAFHNQSLYIAAVNKLYRMDKIEADLANPPPLKLIRDDFPRRKAPRLALYRIWSRSAFVHGDGALCNVCLKEDYAVIRCMKADGSDQRVEVKGVRNSVGFTWHPQNKNSG